MVRVSSERDVRVTPTRRIITIEILDNTPIPLTSKDMEWLGDAVEDLLRQRYDVTVDAIDVENQC